MKYHQSRELFTCPQRPTAMPWVRSLFLLLPVCLLASISQAQDLSDVLGICHVDGKYFLTHDDYLDEGANQVLATGSKVLKIYLAPGRYPWNSAWPKDFKDLRSIAQSPYFQSIFNRPFTTYIMTAYCVGHDDHYWVTGITDEQKAEETRQFHDLTEYLLTTYKGTGKTFVLQHWEGDWALRNGHKPDYDPTYQPDQTAINGMIQWINARQAGIVAARTEVKDTDVHVYGATEANLVEASMEGKPGVINSVLPHTTVDLVSYSCYISLKTPERLGKAIDFIAANLPPTAAFGQTPHSIYLGEFGYPENGDEGADGVNSRMNSALAIVKSKGVKWALFWEVYCNELKKPVTTAPVNGNDMAVMGYWMVKPDGKPGVAWHRYRQAIITSDPARATSSAIKAGLTPIFIDRFDRPDGTDLGPTWSEHSHYGTVNQSLHDHHLLMEIPDGSKIPWGSATLDLKNPAALGRGLNVGEYYEFTIARKSEQCSAGVELFGSDQLRQGAGMADSTPLMVWNSITWIPVSIDDQGQSISYDWSQPHTIGVRFDSADGHFTSFSYYIDGNYAGSWLAKTGNKTMNTIGLFAQSRFDSSSVEFSNLALFGRK
jgi:hypothetical protein